MHACTHTHSFTFTTHYTLWPLIQVSVQLHARYPTDYPDSPPQLQLLEPQHLSEDLVKQLLEEINQLAKERVGEVWSCVCVCVSIAIFFFDRWWCWKLHNMSRRSYIRTIVHLSRFMKKWFLDRRERKRRREEECCSNKRNTVSSWRKR